MDSRQGVRAEPRTEKTALALTRTEKQALRLVATYRKVTESELLRAMLISQIVAEYDRLMAALERVS